MNGLKDSKLIHITLPYQQSQNLNESEHQQNEIENQSENKNIPNQLSINHSLATNTQTFEQNNPPQLQINHHKYNKNVIDFSAALHLYVSIFVLSIGLPLMYFVRHPRHLINVLIELQLL